MFSGGRVHWHSPSEVRPAEDARLIEAFVQRVTTAAGRNAFRDLCLTVEDLVLAGRPFFYEPPFLSYTPGEILESKMCSMFAGFSRGQDRAAMAAGRETPVFRTDPFRVARVFFRSMVQETRARHQAESRTQMGATLARLGIRMDWPSEPGPCTDVEPVRAATAAAPAAKASAPRP